MFLYPDLRRKSRKNNVSWTRQNCTYLTCFHRSPLLSLHHFARIEIHDSILHQSSKHENEAHEQEPINGLGVRDLWQRRTRTVRNCNHGQNSCNAQSYAGRRRVGRDPEREPGDGDSEHGWDVRLNHVITQAPTESESGHQRGMGTCSRWDVFDSVVGTFCWDKRTQIHRNLYNKPLPPVQKRVG